MCILNLSNNHRGLLLLSLLILTSFDVWAVPPLVDGNWLEARLGTPGLVIVDMSSEKAQYQRFHLPGAVRLPYEALVTRRSDGVSQRVGDRRLVQILGLLGIEVDDHVVIYDDMGGLHGGRLYWELERIGHPSVSLLDGGLVRWILDGRKVDNLPVRPERANYLPADKLRQNLADVPMVVEAITNHEIVLLDVRSEKEYKGSRNVKRSGHIPGARWWSWDQAVDFNGGFVAADPKQLLESLGAVGAKPETTVIAYCRSGHRASQTYFTLRWLGFEDVRVYDGSTAEWSARNDLPIRTGRQP